MDWSTPGLIAGVKTQAQELARRSSYGLVADQLRVLAARFDRVEAKQKGAH
jgi:hypothetical protein